MLVRNLQNKDVGSLTVATTHTQARYALPTTIRKFTTHYPKIKLTIRQGNPTQISKLVTSGEADVAIATEAIEFFHELVMLPCYQWNRCIITPPEAPATFPPRGFHLKILLNIPLLPTTLHLQGVQKLIRLLRPET